MPTDQHTPLCSTSHYLLSAQCGLVAGHGDTWHRTAHPDTGALLRFRSAGAVRHTQEWEPDDDPGEPDAGQWITWHYGVAPEPTPVIVSDLDERAAALVGSHFPTSRTRPGPDGGRDEEECACGAWYRAGRPDIHLGRHVSLLARSFFDLALRYAQEPAPLAD
ncbi:hypothetical protein [Streptomyces sp. H39-S7]|uniref:hypothetical protein n=1 Tax=Streptomyces sp. H39-S7 TaxID=3004357 RepID=UPI0022AEA7C7|nr:hypothetical protein [Streptomyces sp. H39-S7]MCZ4124971.1 hypothetical protein [Streptomyces sp. H39-S7]